MLIEGVGGEKFLNIFQFVGKLHGGVLRATMRCCGDFDSLEL